MNIDARVEALEAENERLRDRIEELERILQMDAGWFARVPVEWRLTPSEARVLGLLSSRDCATKEAIMAALYDERPNEVPEIKIVDVFICKIRKKVKPFGIEIVTVWGTGYRLADASRTVVSALGAREAA